MDISRTFNSLRPDAKFTGDMSNAFSLETLAKTYIGTMPTQVEMESEWAKLQADDATNAYVSLRKEKYNLLNQDEMRYDDLINSTTTWQDAIAAIKQEYPK
jgi:hypothetical protein